MAPFEALYGRRCRTPIYWEEVGERKLLRLQLIQLTTKNIHMVQANLKVAKDKQRSYANIKQANIEYNMGDKVFLRISPSKGVIRFSKCEKLSPRFIEPYEIMERIGHVAYHLALPPKLAGVHDMFYVLMLRQYRSDPSHILQEQSIKLKENINYEEKLVAILARDQKVLRNKIVPLVKVLWKNHSRDEAIWKRDEDIRQQYPNLLF